MLGKRQFLFTLTREKRKLSHKVTSLTAGNERRDLNGTVVSSPRENSKARRKMAAMWQKPQKSPFTLVVKLFSCETFKRLLKFWGVILLLVVKLRRGIKVHRCFAYLFQINYDYTTPFTTIKLSLGGSKCIKANILMRLFKRLTQIIF